MKSWIVDFFTHFTWEKTPQNNFSSQNFSVENNYCIILNSAFHISIFLLLGLGLLNNDMISTWKVKMQLKDSPGNYPLKQHKEICENWFCLLMDMQNQILGPNIGLNLNLHNFSTHHLWINNTISWHIN